MRYSVLLSNSSGPENDPRGEDKSKIFKHFKTKKKKKNNKLFNTVAITTPSNCVQYNNFNNVHDFHNNRLCRNTYKYYSSTSNFEHSLT